MPLDAPKALHQLGQSLWLDNITRDLLDSGTLEGIHRPHVGDRSDLEPDDLRSRDLGQRLLRCRDPSPARCGPFGRGVVLRSCRAGPRRARPICSRPSTRAPAPSTASCRWRSRRCSPTTPAATLAQAKALHAQADRPNLFIKIPGTTEGLPAIEAAIFAGVPINVTLLFSTEQYLAAADAYLKGLERRVAAGLSADVRSVASLFVSRWDRAVTRAAAGRDAQHARPRGRPGRPTRPTATCCRAIGSSAWRTSARGRSGCCSRAPAPRTRARRTRSTSPASRRRTRSTRCRRRRCSPSPIMGPARARCRATAAMRNGAGRARQGRHRRHALAARLQAEGAKGFVEILAGAAGRDRRQEQGADLDARETAQDRADRDAGLAGARRASGADQGRASAQDVRRRSRARRALHRRGRRPVPRLFEEPHHRRDAAAAVASGGGAQRGGAARRHVRAARRSTRPRSRAVLHVALRAPRGAAHRGRRRTTSCADVHSGARRMAASPPACAPAPGPATPASASGT